VYRVDMNSMEAVDNPFLKYPEDLDTLGGEIGDLIPPHSIT
jgi:hypothetical protein